MLTSVRCTRLAKINVLVEKNSLRRTAKICLIRCLLFDYRTQDTQEVQVERGWRHTELRPRVVFQVPRPLAHGARVQVSPQYRVCSEQTRRLIVMTFHCWWRHKIIEHYNDRSDSCNHHFNVIVALYITGGWGGGGGSEQWKVTVENYSVHCIFLVS